MEAIQTLIVEDEAATATLHRRHLAALEGFAWAGCARNGEEMLRILADVPVDLLLLDLRLEGMHGLDALRLVRSSCWNIDAICVSGDNAVETVTDALRLGAFDYLLKPVEFDRFQETMSAYRNYRQMARHPGDNLDQAAIDALRPTPSQLPPPLPKGIQRPTLELFADFLRRQTGPITARETAAALNVARTTAARYLEHLCRQGILEIEPRFSGTGRPPLVFRWKADLPSPEEA